MGIKDRFAEQFARQKTMTGPEKKANDIIGKIMMKKLAIFIVAMVVFSIVAIFAKWPWWVALIADIVIAIGAFLYMRVDGKKYQNFTPYVGNLISVEKKSEKLYVALLKQGKKPIKLDIRYGGEDLMKVKKNTLVQISYNPNAKMAVLITKNNLK